MASNKNEVVIEGNIVRDPELKHTGSGLPVCNFSIASNRFHKKGDEFEKETSFFDIQCWADLAQYVGEKGVKGSTVITTGRLKQERWTDREGKNKNKVIIVAESVQIFQRQNGDYQRQGQSVNDNASDCPF
jgi:single-strand DNA-binding protein